MRKLWLCMLILTCLLSGCAKSDEDRMIQLMNKLQDTALLESFGQVNINKELYSYYLPRDVGRIENHDISSVLIKDGTKFIMNFNPNNIVIRDFYNTEEEHYSSIVQKQFDSKNEFILLGRFLQHNNIRHNFRLYVDPIGDDEVILVLDCNYVFFYAVCHPLEIESLSTTMLTIAKSVRYDASEVVNAYSLKSTSESVKESIDDYSDEFPDSGYISDLIGGN